LPSDKAIPTPEQVDRTVNAPLPEACPRCGTPLGSTPVVVHDQYQID
jgi:hypothetical protein